ncbi:MAG: hypothetical protein LBM94_05360 [Propionibacteriaceae bacterium]|jgi:mannosyltransferase|nr:hypothetical protein [Propionibacteriaceae bacterium]
MMLDADQDGSSAVLGAAEQSDSDSALQTMVVGQRGAWQWPALVGVVSFLINIAWVTTPAIWYDEAATVSVAMRPGRDILTFITTRADVVHGLYYLAMHEWLGLTGYSMFALRFPSVVAVTVASTGLVVLGQLLENRRAGVMAGLVFIATPACCFYGIEARPYAAAIAGAVLLTCVAFWMSHAEGWQQFRALAALYCVFLALLVYLHLYTVFMVAPHAFLLLDRARPTGRVLSARSVVWLGAVFVAVLASLPLILLAWRQRRQVAFISDVYSSGTAQLKSVLVEAWVGDNLTLAVVFVLFALLGFRTLAGRQRWAIAAWMWCPALVLSLPGLLFGLDFWLPRYMQFSVPALCLAVAFGIDHVSARFSSSLFVCGLALAAVFTLALPTWADDRTPAGKSTGWLWIASLADNLSEIRSDSPSGKAGVVFGMSPSGRQSTRWVSVAYPEALIGLDDISLYKTAIEANDFISYSVDSATVLNRLTGGGLTCVYVMDTASRPFFSADQVAQIEAQGFTEIEQRAASTARVTRMCRPA